METAKQMKTVCSDSFHDIFYNCKQHTKFNNVPNDFLHHNSIRRALYRTLCVSVSVPYPLVYLKGHINCLIDFLQTVLVYVDMCVHKFGYISDIITNYIHGTISG